ncbi:hypothetical protein QBC43DRAFT_43158 [Cladorrhinum sp. PSN259]|nr:hypothetical protein QBC43DRAFT_43158 [Cladorrhinum sp. PSN259]
MLASPFLTPFLVLALIAYSLTYSGPADGLLLAFSFFIRRDLDWPLVMQAVASAIITFALFQIFRIGRLSLAAIEIPQWKGPCKLLLYPCEASHARFFPKEHSFSSRYLAVGIPVGFEGNAGGMVSVGMGRDKDLSPWFSLASQAPKGWFHVDPGDYLRRGNAELGLRGKLDEYLQSEGVDPTSYPDAYLVTTPRFLGYQFNPYSFWYLYDADKCLAAIIVEINNIFDERRMYYMPLDSAGNGQISDGKENYQDCQTSFKQSWAKDFHVSPFSSRKGSYKLATSNPLGASLEYAGPLSIALDLLSSKGHLKLRAKLTSAGVALDPSEMAILEKIRFLTSWWWVGLVTVPRIFKEAAVLFYGHKLHVWWRPEPRKGTIGRRAVSIERQLEPLFRRYLCHLVDQSPAKLAVKYVASGTSEHTEELMLSSRARNGLGATEELEVRVLTPAFYSRFVYYAHDLEAVFCELHESRTIWISRPELLPELLLRKQTTKLESSNLKQYAYFKMIQHLRVRPERIDRPMTSSSAKKARAEPKANVVDIRNFYISPMDAYVMANESAAAQSVYQDSVLKLFLADKIAFRSIRLFEVERLLLQAGFAWLLSSVMVEMARRLSSTNWISIIEKRLG